MLQKENTYISLNNPGKKINYVKIVLKNGI